MFSRASRTSAYILEKGLTCLYMFNNDRERVLMGFKDLAVHAYDRSMLVCCGIKFPFHSGP